MYEALREVFDHQEGDHSQPQPRLGVRLTPRPRDHTCDRHCDDQRPEQQPDRAESEQKLRDRTMRAASPEQFIGVEFGRIPERLPTVADERFVADGVADKPPDRAALGEGGFIPESRKPCCGYQSAHPSSTNSERGTGPDGASEITATPHNQHERHEERDDGRGHSSAAPTPPEPDNRSEYKQPTSLTDPPLPPRKPAKDSQPTDRRQAVATRHRTAPVIVGVERCVRPQDEEGEADHNKRTDCPYQGIDEPIEREVRDHPRNERQRDVDDSPPKGDLGLQTPPRTHRRPHPEQDSRCEGKPGNGSQPAADESKPVEHNERNCCAGGKDDRRLHHRVLPCARQTKHTPRQKEQRPVRQHDEPHRNDSGAQRTREHRCIVASHLIARITERSTRTPTMLTLSPSARKSVNLIIHFAERESKARYKRSLLGWFWSFANSLTTVAVYSFVFGAVYNAQPPITDNGRAENFGLYLFTGLITWTVFTGVVTGCMGWLQDVSDLRKKIYFPTETALLGGAACNAIQTALEAAVLLVIMALFTNISWTALFLVFALLLTMMFALGIGFIVAVLNSRYRDIQYLTGVLIGVGFFLVPVVYPPSLLEHNDVPEIARQLVTWNPPAIFVEIARDGVYFLQTPDPLRVLVATAWAVGTFAVGWLYFRSRSMEISEEL